MGTPDPVRRQKNLTLLAEQRRAWTPEERGQVAVFVVAELAAFVPLGDWKRAVRAAMVLADNTSIFDALDPDNEPVAPPTPVQQVRTAADAQGPGWQGVRVADEHPREVCAAITPTGRACTRPYRHLGRHTSDKDES